MNSRLFPSPWAAFAGEKGVALRGDSFSYPCGAVHARLIGRLPDRAIWNGSHPVLALAPDDPDDCHWDLPFQVSGDQAGCVWVGDEQSTLVEFEGLRPRASEAAREGDPREQWLVWQLQRYAELADLGGEKGGHDPLEGRLPWGARRTWQSVERYWRMGGDEAAELALVVRLAQDERLIHALRSIERGPRRTLLRRHEKVKISRIQEMDSGTLRAYSQAPGSNAVQKAGAKQELLAVVRQDTVDLVENRLLLWVAERVRRMAEVYCQRNRLFQTTNRFQRVRQLHRLCQHLIRSPSLEEVGLLPHHLSAPTYCLQFERRYRQLWRAYGLIRRQDRLEDDAWQWQTHFWGTSARLIVGSMLLGLDGWEEARLSMPYFRDQGICGEWVHGPSSPGPFTTPFGTCHVLDLRAGRGFQGGGERRLPEVATRSGADWLLVWPEGRRLLLLWSAVATGVLATDGGSLGVDRLSGRMGELTLETDWAWGGILFVAEPEVEPERIEYLDAAPRVVTLRIPMDVHARWEDVQAGLQLAMEELHRG